MAGSTGALCQRERFCSLNGCSLWHPVEGICEVWEKCNPATCQAKTKHKRCKFGFNCNKFPEAMCKYSHPVHGQNHQLRNDDGQQQRNINTAIGSVIDTNRQNVSVCRNGYNCKRNDCKFWHPIRRVCENPKFCRPESCPTGNYKIHYCCIKGNRCREQLETCLYYHEPICKCENETCTTGNHQYFAIEKDSVLNKFSLPRHVQYSLTKGITDLRKEIDETKMSLIRRLSEADEKNTEEERKQANDIAITIRQKVKELMDQRKSFCTTVERTLRSGNLQQSEKNASIMRDIFRLDGRLPALAKRIDFEKALSENQFLVVIGHTGSGKSTQLPQYIAEMEQFRSKKVLVTQPRKLAAMALAGRVAYEFAAGCQQFAKVGRYVGYRTGAYYKSSQRTRIEYATEDALLQQLMADRTGRTEKYFKKIDLSEYCVIIIDEAHERNIATDLLLGLVKEVENLKVIVTSATLNKELFSKHFYDCLVIEIPGRLFPVEVTHRNHTIEEIAAGDVVELAVNEVLNICNLSDSSAENSILCFLMGQIEVEAARKKTMQRLGRAKNNVTVVMCLYGKQTPDEQNEVFKPTAGNKRKIVYATDVAETSVTIDGIRFVVDCGLAKDTVYDSKKNITSLKVIPISQSSAVQRKGRAGRTAPGFCFRLYSEDEFDQLDESPTAEIKRRPLSLTIARLIAMNIDPTYQPFTWVEAPDGNAISAAIEELECLGAISNLYGVREITDIGRYIVQLQVDPGIGRMLFYSCREGYGEAACVIAGLMSVGDDIFWRGGDANSKENADKKKREFDSKKGDVVSYYQVYNKWLEMRGKVNKIPRKREQFVPNAGRRAWMNWEGVVPSDKLFFLPSEDGSESVADNSMASTSQADDDIGSVGTVEDEQESAEIQEELDDQLAKDANVNAWVKENCLNKKMLFTVFSTTREYRRILIHSDLWKARPQTENVNDEKVQRLAMNSLLLNTAVKTIRGSYHVILTGSTGVIHPGSLVSSQDFNSLPKWVCFHDILHTSKPFLKQILPIEIDWIKEANADLYEKIVSKAEKQNLPTCEVKIDVSKKIANALFGKKHVNHEALVAKVGCGELSMDYEGEAIIAMCAKGEEVKVAERLNDEIRKVREKALSKVTEEEYIGATRVVWGKGGDVIDILFGNQFTTIKIRNLPPDYTEDKLLEMIRKYGQILYCLLVPTDNSQCAHIVFKDQDTAAKALQELQGELIGDQLIKVSPGGVRHPSLYHDVTAKIVLSFANAPSLGMCYLVYETAEDANALLRQKDIFGTDIVMTAKGNRYDQISGFQAVIQHGIDKRSNQGPKTLPTVDQDGFFVSCEESNVNGFVIELSKLPKHVDEIAIEEIIRSKQMPEPKRINVRREDIKKDSEGCKKLSDEINELVGMIPFRYQIVSYTSFENEQAKRGGLNAFFATVDDASLAYDELRTFRTAKEKNGQPLRMKIEFSQRIAIHRALWDIQIQAFKEIIAELKKNRVHVLEDEGKKSAKTFTTIDLGCGEVELLHQARARIQSCLDCTLYENKQKSLLLTNYGRQILKQVSNRISFLHWDSKSNMIRIYGSPQNRMEVIEELDRQVAALSKLCLEESVIIDGRHRREVRSNLEKYKKDSGVLHLRLAGGRLTASGQNASIDQLKKLLTGKISPPNVGNRLSCVICLGDTEQEDISLEACGHRYHRACIEDTAERFSDTTLPLPVKCLVDGCGLTLTADDIRKVFPGELLPRLMEVVVDNFIKANSRKFRKCVKPACIGILQVCETAVRATQEALAGGQVSTCDQCMEKYCVRCSDQERQPICAHVGYTCEQAKEQRRLLETQDETTSIRPTGKR